MQMWDNWFKVPLQIAVSIFHFPILSLQAYPIQEHYNRIWLLFPHHLLKLFVHLHHTTRYCQNESCEHKIKNETHSIYWWRLCTFNVEIIAFQKRSLNYQFTEFVIKKKHHVDMAIIITKEIPASKLYLVFFNLLILRSLEFFF